MKGIKLRNGYLALFLAIGTYVSTAQAQPYDRLISFGDSYADSGVNVYNLLMSSGLPYPSNGATPEEIAASYSWVAFPYWVQKSLGINNSDMFNYAIGGSTTQTLNANGLPISMPFQLATWNGQRFGENDLVSISVGGNDGLSASGIVFALTGSGPDGSAFTDAAAQALGQQVSASVTSTVSQFANAGARNVVVSAFSDMSLMPITAFAPNPAAIRTYAASYHSSLQAELRPLAESGVRIFLVDVGKTIEKIANDLPSYGLQTAAFAGSTETSLFMPDGIHLSSRGFEIFGGYISNIVQAPYSIAATANVAQSTAASFSTGLMDRLSSNRAMNWQKVNEGVSVYALGAHSKGSDDGGGELGYDDYRGGSGAVGIELGLNPNLLTGLALSYTRSHGDIGRDRIESESNQFAVYLSYTDGGWWADALASYGDHNLDLQREGVISSVSSDADAETLGASVRGGYLFDFGSFQAGPFIGVKYLHSEVDSFDEHGDELLNYEVRSQTLSSKTAEAGLRIQAPFTIQDYSIGSFLSVAWQHEFGDDSRTLEASLEQAPLLPIKTSIDNYGARNYGVVSGGLSAGLTENLRASLTVSSTFARDKGDAHQVGASLDYSF
ncbi:hypothetical protein DOQ73_23090 [Salmonella enterica subsp. enterica]|nr:hypothetical protein [Salmonella enterica subsp. enterica serovar Javiana]